MIKIIDAIFRGFTFGANRKNNSAQKITQRIPPRESFTHSEAGPEQNFVKKPIGTITSNEMIVCFLLVFNQGIRFRGNHQMLKVFETYILGNQKSKFGYAVKTRPPYSNLQKFPKKYFSERTAGY